jgi:hypothetical protein
MPEHNADIVGLGRQRERLAKRTARNRLHGSLDGLPLMLSIEEAAQVLRISRTSAYKLVSQYAQTAGAAGLPHVRLGGRLLVRRVDLAAIVGLPPSG